MQVQRREVLLAGLFGAGGLLLGCSPSRQNGFNGSIDAASRHLAHVGDSISVASNDSLIGLYKRLGFVEPVINAQVGRRLEVSGGILNTIAGSEIVDFVVKSPTPPNLWVLALGTNDLGQYADAGAYTKVIDAMLARIPSSAALVWVDTYAAKQLDQAQIFNDALRTVLATRPNSVVGDWHSECVKANGDILTDGVHPTGLGVVTFVEVIRAALIKLLG